ncbi:hypothetical protein PIB30_099644 [Stylosanthes scabra]|uniref:Uncharacterized protein n=1 Tax=Stylosanthes scabra TaxID=79078 RepID=A0ABU6YVV0_9FABA|nr:hypothetical protein [Stylosanthes scabra]
MMLNLERGELARCGLAEGGGRWLGWLGAWRTVTDLATEEEDVSGARRWWTVEARSGGSVVVSERERKKKAAARWFGDGWKLEEDGGYGHYGGLVDFEDDVDEDGGGFVKKKVARRWWTGA